jgi:hypothetical protein
MIILDDDSQENINTIGRILASSMHVKNRVFRKYKSPICYLNGRPNIVFSILDFYFFQSNIEDGNNSLVCVRDIEKNVES